MADFSNVEIMFTNMQKSLGILSLLRDIYFTSTKVEAILAAYQTDAAFKDEVDHLYSADQLAELGAMVVDVQTFRANWAANHSQLLGPGVPT